VSGITQLALFAVVMLLASYFLLRPILAYCRSGTRSAILWQMASQTANPR